MSSLVAPILAMAAVVVASNVGVQVLVADGWLTWGAFTYPLAFLVTDVTARRLGAAAARRVVLAGFAVGLACSAVGTQIEGAYGPLVTWRVALGSGVAFLAAQLLDVGSRCSRRCGAGAGGCRPRSRRWRAARSTPRSSFTIAFSASLAWIEPAGDVGWAQAATVVGPLWVGMALADYSVKAAVGLAALAPFRWLTRGSPRPAA